MDQHKTENIDQIINQIKRKNKTSSTILCETEGVYYLRFPIFEEYQNELLHGFSTRLGGVSKAHLYSMNLSFSRGDDPENVMENHRRLGRAIGYDHRRLVFSDQVHKTAIRNCTAEDCGKGIIRKSDILETDGLLTNEPNVPLMTFYADCVPLFFYEPQKKVAGLAHSGWKGTCGEIGKKMVERMVSDYGCDRGEIRCAIGPSICMDCYEVSADVIEEFSKVYSDKEMDTMTLDKGQGKYQLDLWKACEYNFLHAGIKKEYIAVTDLCTCCNPDFLFSHRASHGKRGNLSAVIMLKE